MKYSVVEDQAVGDYADRLKTVPGGSGQLCA